MKKNKLFISFNKDGNFEHLKAALMAADNLRIQKKEKTNQVSYALILNDSEVAYIRPTKAMSKILKTQGVSDELKEFFTDSDIIEITTKKAKFSVIDMKELPETWNIKSKYSQIAIIDIQSDEISIENVKTSPKNNSFTVKAYANIAMFPSQRTSVAKIRDELSSNRTVRARISSKHSDLKNVEIYYETDDMKEFELFGSLITTEIENIPEYVKTQLSEGKSFDGEFLETSSDTNDFSLKNHFNLVINYQESISENLSDVISPLVENGMLSEEDAIFLNKKFAEYKLPNKMIKAILAQWKDYGPELNAMIPSVREAIFIDNKHERYVFRCSAHILGNNNKFPRLRLVGHLSTGKDVLIRTLAALFHKPIDIVTIFSDTQKEDIFGAKTIESQGLITYQPEPLIRAMENGTWIEFDEINTCDSGVLESLHKILDTERAVNVTGYKRVEAKEGFGFFASMNPSDSNYNGTQSMNPATQSRMKTIEIKKTVSLKDILQRKCPYADEDDINKCVRIYELIEQSVEKEGLSEAFLAVRLYEDALDSACWLPIKQSLIDVVAHADTNDSEECAEVVEIINQQLVD